MTADMWITVAVIGVSMVLFALNRIPAAVVAVLAGVVLYLTGVITADEAVAGLGDPLVIMIAGLLAIAVALERSGVGAWTGRLLAGAAGPNPRRRIVLMMLVAAVFSALIGMNGAVAALLPVVVAMAVRSGESASRMMIPLAFACLTGSSLTLLGSPVNMIGLAEAEEFGAGHIGFFEWAVVGVPLVAGTIVAVVLLGDRLIPDRSSSRLPADLSGHVRTLVEHYRVHDRIHRIEVVAGSGLIGSSPAEITADHDVTVLDVQRRRARAPRSDGLRAGDTVVLRGEGDAVVALAAATGCAVVESDPDEHLADSLISERFGLAEAVVPARSPLIGDEVFPGMTVYGSELMVLAVGRADGDLRRRPTRLREGDHLLVQGTWPEIDSYLVQNRLLAVVAPEALAAQRGSLGRSGRTALTILGLLVVLLAFDLVPGPVAAIACSALMVVFRVVSLPQMFRGIDWNTCVLVGAMIAPATAMTTTGLAREIGEFIVDNLGAGGPVLVLAGLFVASAAVSQFISNTASALVMMPIAVVAAEELDVSLLPMIVGVVLGAGASFLTPYANGVSVMVHGPGGYRFGDYWRMGLVVTLWSLVVTVVVVPLYWGF